MTMESYRVPVQVREGVEVKLRDGTIFRVKLPSHSNKPWMRAMTMAWGDQQSEGGLGALALAEQYVVIDAQREAFARYCLVHPLPGDMSFATLRDEYPDALDEIFAEAIRLGRELDAEASDAAKKSLPIKAGSSVGRRKAISTSSSNGPGGSPSETDARESVAMAG